MKKKIIVLLSAPILAIMLSSWGGVGHQIISFKTSLSFNDEMAMFNNWVTYMTEHASDADSRKYTGDYPDEGPKHYIDIDNYSGFVNDGRIPHTLDSCLLVYGSKLVFDNGTLPWATMATYDSIVACLKRGDESRAKFFAADLGHYVADGHMPMHLTANYDGQLSGNKGIHSRYESKMLEKYSSEISYEGMPIQLVENVQDYIFEYIYSNFVYMDSILIADDYATGIAGNNTSDLYYEKLWEKTENLTKVQFKLASHAISELLYTAMKEAEGIVENINANENANPYAENGNNFSLNIFPNPMSDCASIQFNTPSTDGLSVSVHDMSGRQTEEFTNIDFQAGTNSFEWNTLAYNPGTYLVVVRNNEFQECNRVLIYR